MAHSSSQRRSDPMGNTPPPKLPVTINDARWTSSPSGRYSFQETKKSIYFTALLNNAGEIAKYSAPQRRSDGLALRLQHRCHSPTSLPIADSLIYREDTSGQRTPPPSAPRWDRQYSSSQLPIRISNARRTSSPAGVVFYLPLLPSISTSSFSVHALAQNLVKLWPSQPRGLQQAHGCDAALSL